MKLLNRYPNRRERSRGFAGYMPGNYYNMAAIFEDNWSTYGTSTNLAVLHPPWIVIADNTHNGVFPGQLTSGDVTTLGSMSVGIPATYNVNKPWRISGSFTFKNPALIGTSIQFESPGFLNFLFRLQITAGPTVLWRMYDTTNGIIGTQVCTGLLPGQVINYEYINYGSPDLINGSASLFSNLSPTGIVPGLVPIFLNKNTAGPPDPVAGFIIATNAVTDLTNPYMIGIGPVGLYGSLQ